MTVEESLHAGVETASGPTRDIVLDIALESIVKPVKERGPVPRHWRNYVIYWATEIVRVRAGIGRTGKSSKLEYP